MNPERVARSERLADYFDLQLTFASRMAEVLDIPLTESVGLYTNLHRRFGLGPIEEGPAPLWQEYTASLAACDAQEQRVVVTQDFFRRGPDESLPANEARFGCFSYAFREDMAGVRIHFVNRDSADGIGPLNRAKIPARRRELREMFAHVARHCPAAKHVLGGSWIYHVDAYCRLFPPEYIATRCPPNRKIRLNGSSSWGQFLTYRESVKPDLRDQFLVNMQTVDPERPWECFPLPALVATGDVELFYDFFDVKDVA